MFLLWSTVLNSFLEDLTHSKSTAMPLPMPSGLQGVFLEVKKVAVCFRSSRDYTSIAGTEGTGRQTDAGRTDLKVEIFI